MVKRNRKTGYVIMWLFLVCFCSFSIIDKSITESSTVSLLLVLLPVIGTLAVSLISHRGRIGIRFSIMFKYLLLLDIFCYISSTWAINPQYAVSKGNTLLIVLFALFIFDMCLPREDRVKYILCAVMWSGYIVAVFAGTRYGWGHITDVLSRNMRLDNTVLNANALGMAAAFSILICIFFLFDEGFTLHNTISVCFAALSVIILAASGSRKAMFVIVIGLSILLIIRNADKRNLSNTVIKIFAYIVALILLFLFLSHLEMFQGLMDRIQSMINAFMKTEGGDRSTYTRLRLIDIGKEIFYRNPIVGIGIDNAQIFTRTEFGIENYYLHNNYIELLADGGIVGFITYYWIYAILIKQYWKDRDFQWGEFNICFALMIVKLIMDFGMVTYETENNYIFILMFVALLSDANARKKEIVPRCKIYDSAHPMPNVEMR